LRGGLNRPWPLAFPMVLSDLYTRVRGSAYAGKMTRYAIGSVVALSTSVIVFAVMDWLGIHTAIDSAAAFIAGAIPNWVLNRKWAWKMEDRADFMREIVAYIVISLLVWAASSWATGATQTWVDANVAKGTGLRVILVTGAYVAVQAVFFVVKFVIYDKWVFAGRSRVRAALRSRHQVWTAARANRTP
jgi:putative flippase GtrA